MNRTLLNLWFVLVFTTGVFSSCHKDTQPESNSPTRLGDSVTLHLSAEIGFEEEDTGDLKALSFKIEQVGSKKIPRPQFPDGAEVDVHTIVRSSDGIAGVATLKWKCVSDGRKLVLKASKESNKNITIANFNNDGGRRWYIAAMIGGTLRANSTEVDFSGTRELRGVSGNIGDNLGNLNIPYWTGWAELSINTSTDRDGYGSHAEAHVPQASNLRFKPLGSLIAFKLGNEQTGGNHTFTPTGFSVTSNAYTDNGIFKLNVDHITGIYPAWQIGKRPMVYTFAPGHAPSTIPHNSSADKTYYAWVMPHSASTKTTHTQVFLHGTSSKYASNPTKDYTKTYFTDYRPSTSGTKGRPSQGKIHLLKANATHRITIPIEHVTEYNLAGGGLVQNFTINGTPNQQSEGIKGDLRFSNVLSDGVSPNPNPHRNDQSGYYNIYELMGVSHKYNNPGPTPRNVTAAINAKWPNTYFVPEGDHWWGVWGVRNAQSWSNAPEVSNVYEYFQLGYNEQSYWFAQSDYSASVPVNDATDNAVFYAIRFKATNDYQVRQNNWFYDLSTGSPVPRIYDPLRGNVFRCAFRYTRVGGRTSWDTNHSLTNHLIIDVVHLGNDPNVTSVGDISNPAWWSNQPSGKIISRTFPASGKIQLFGSSYSEGYLSYRGKEAQVQSMSLSNIGIIHGEEILSRHAPFCSGDLIYGDGSESSVFALPVRLWKRDPEQP